MTIQVRSAQVIQYKYQINKYLCKQFYKWQKGFKKAWINHLKENLQAKFIRNLFTYQWNDAYLEDKRGIMG